jgi:hypothetical protein
MSALSRRSQATQRATRGQQSTAIGRQGAQHCPTGLALERLMAEAQLDGEPIGAGDRISALFEALLAKCEAWDWDELRQPVQ